MNPSRIGNCGIIFPKMLVRIIIYLLIKDIILDKVAGAC
jgi:hypothetical protein